MLFVTQGERPEGGDLGTLRLSGKIMKTLNNASGSSDKNGRCMIGIVGRYGRIRDGTWEC